MHVVATTGLLVAAVGAALVFLVPGGLWSDVPGWALLVLGATVELLATAAMLLDRGR